MDLSKLPKMSKTPKPGADAPETASPGAAPSSSSSASIAPAANCLACGLPLRAGARFCDACGAPTARAGRPAPGAGAEAWISIAVGVILLLLFPHLIQYLIHRGTTAFDAIDSQTGAAIPYTRSAFIWPDIGVTFFCLFLIVDALLMLLVPRRPVVMLALALSVGCAALNLFVVIKSMDILGFQVVCAIAIAFSIYIAIHRWSNLRSSI